MDVRMPDGTVIKNVPDGITKSELQRKLGALNGVKREAGIAAAQVAVQQARGNRVGTDEPERGLRLHAPGPMGLALDLGSNMVRNTLAASAGGIKGIASGIANLGDNDYAATEAVESLSGLAGEPLTAEGRAVSKLVSKPFEALGKFANWAGGETAEATGSPAVGAGLNTAIQAAPAILLKGRGTPSPSRGVAPGKGKPSSTAPASQRSPGLGGVPPTIEELAAQSKAAYRRASDAGVNITPGSFQNVKSRVNATLKKEGIDPTLHPQTTAALKRINETKGAVSLDQLETLRKIANDARGAGKADGRLASKIVDDLDDYMGGISRKDITSGDPKGFAALQEARNLYSRKAKAEEIARLVKRAEISAPNFSASGYENALRTEFRTLAKNDRKMRRFSAEERAAIERVAKGGKIENALRMLGKMAPTGAVSGMFGIAATAAIPGGVALPVAGLASRYAATRMTSKNALLAEEIMRRGPPSKTRSKNALIELTEQRP